jgi:hypothetical protein
LASNLKDVQNVKVTLWVDRASYFVRHLESSLTFTPDKSMIQNEDTVMQGNPLAGISEVDQVTLSTTVDLDKFNQAVTFEEPQDAQDASEFFSKMMTATPSAGASSMELPSELQGLSPQQKAELEKLKHMSDKNKKMLEELQVPELQ